MKYDVKDISLAAKGKLRLNMPSGNAVLRLIRDRFEKETAKGHHACSMPPCYNGNCEPGDYTQGRCADVYCVHRTH